MITTQNKMCRDLEGRLRALAGIHPSLNEDARALINEAATEIEELHKWVLATARSFKDSGLTIDE